MDSPLDYDLKVIKEFGIDDKIDLAPSQKLGFSRTQFEEIQKFLWRERMELMMAEAQMVGASEAVIANAQTKVAEHRNNIRGIVASLRLLADLTHELETSLPTAE